MISPAGIYEFLLLKMGLKININLDYYISKYIFQTASFICCLIVLY